MQRKCLWETILGAQEKPCPESTPRTCNQENANTKFSI